MGFRSDWEAATAAANDPNDQYHEAGVAYTNALNDYIASTDQGNYDLSNKSIPQKPQSFGYYKETNKLADYAIDRDHNSGGNYGNAAENNNGQTSYDNDSGNNGKVYGSPRYGGRAENPNVTGTEWNQPGTGFGTGNFLGKALEDIQSNQAQASGTAPVYGTSGYRGVPAGGITQGTEWNQPGTGFGTGNFTGNYAELIDLMRNGNSLEEAQTILNNRDELATMQANNATQPQTPITTPSRLNNDSIRAFKDYQVATGPSGRNTRTREPEWVPVESEVNTSQPIDVWAYNRAVADRQRGLNIDQILLEAEAEGSPQSMQYYNWIVNHMK